MLKRKVELKHGQLGTKEEQKEMINKIRLRIQKFFDSNIVSELNYIREMIKRLQEKSKRNDRFYDISLIFHYNKEYNKFFITKTSGGYGEEQKRKIEEKIEKMEGFMKRNDYEYIGFMTYYDLHYNINLDLFLEEVESDIMANFEKVELSGESKSDYTP